MRQTVNTMETEINLVGSSVFGRYPKISAEKTYNMFISDEWLVNFAGYERILDLLAFGEGRGAFVSTRGNFGILVISANVYRLSTTLGPMLIGQLETTTGEVFIDENLANQICLVDGRFAYIYNWSLPPNLTIQTAGALTSGALIPNYVTYHNTFFLFGNAIRTGDGARWFIYQPDPGDPTMLVEHDEGSLQTKPDFAIAVERIPSQANNILVFGRSVCEIHTQTPNSLETYRRNSSVNIDYGCLSVDTIASSDEHIAWLGVNETNTPVIMVFTGQQATRISTDGIDFVLSRIKRPDKSTALFFRQDGHLFYLLTFYHIDELHPENSDNLSLLYDFNTQKFFHVSDENLDFHPARQVIYFNRELYFVSLRNGSLYRWSTDITQIIEDIPDPNGRIPVDPRLVYDMQRIRICKTFRAPKTTPFIANTIVITLDQGNDTTPGVQECLVILVTEDGIRIFSENDQQLVPEGVAGGDCAETPYRGFIDLSISKDGGVTYSNSVPRYLNTLGVRRNIIKWEQMGWCNEWTPKFRFWMGGHTVAGTAVLDVILAGGNQ